ncbi:MAG TPA: pyridoxamine 5'-phosphate oxidase family protein [Aestuariivirga sp.]|nr:pyridoxamine 5'-phosphate oxidase family protein [Aestuariivirga sp.]
MIEISSFSGTAMRQVLRRARTCSLSTLTRGEGTPYGSLANIASDISGRPLILISRLAWHTQNLLADARASVLVGELPPTGDALVGPRVTVLGRFEPVDDADLRRRYLARHPQARLYADFPDFSFWRLTPSSIHGVAGFGRIETLTPDEVFPSAEEMAALENSAIEHMNHDHAEAIHLYATKILKARPGPWRVLAIDPDGADLGLHEQSLRMEFHTPVFTAEALRKKFAELAYEARTL